MTTVIVDNEEVVPTQYEEKPKEALDTLEQAVGEAPETENATIENVGVEEEVSFEVPAKFKNKTKREILESYANLEQELGRKGQEVGELRQLTDTFLKTQLENTKQPDQQELVQEDNISEVDFFEDPQKAVSSLIEKHPKFKEIEEVSKRSKANEALNTLNSRHPDYKDIITNDGFQSWVQESPIRSRLFVEADNYSVDAADELLSTWKALNGVERNQEVAELKQQKQKRKLKEAHSEVATGSNPSSGKVYRRSDLIRLKMTDPDRYEALGDDIYKAYAEGRVR